MFRQLAIGAARVIESSPSLRARQGARPSRRARRDGGRPRARDPQPARRDQGRRAAADRPRRQAAPSRHTETAEFLEIIVEEANRLNNVVTRFLDYARAERPGREGAGQGRSQRGRAQDRAAAPAGARVKNVELRVRTRRAAAARSPAIPSRCSRCSSTSARTRCRRCPTAARSRSSTTRRRRSRLGYGQFCRGPLPRHRRRHPARSPEEAVHPVLHDQAEGHRPRPRDQPAHHRPARRHDRGALDDRPGLDVLGVPARPPSRCRRARSRTSPRPAGSARCTQPGDDAAPAAVCGRRRPPTADEPASCRPVAPRQRCLGNGVE